MATEHQSPGRLQQYAGEVEHTVTAQMHAASLRELIGSARTDRQYTATARHAEPQPAPLYAEAGQHQHSYCAENCAPSAQPRTNVSEPDAAQNCVRLQHESTTLTRERDNALAQARAMQQRCMSAEQAVQLASQRATAASLVQYEHLQRQLQASQDTAEQSQQAAQQCTAKCVEYEAALRQSASELQQCKRRATAAEQKHTQSILQLRKVLTERNAELDNQRQGTQGAEAACAVAADQVTQLKEANAKLKGDLREAEGLLRRADHDRCSPQCCLLL